MYKPISVCIPAHNEQKTISGTLESILNQSFKGDMEISVCTNGCTDKTEDIVRGYVRQYPKIRLLSTPEKGKPNAWNMLRSNASHNYLFFTDADVVVDKDAFSYLYSSLEKEDKVAVSGIIVPVLKGCDLLTRVLAIPPGSPGCLAGRLYAFNNEKLTEKVVAKGYQAMPNDIIAEDFWLSLVIGKENWATEWNAKVYFKPYDWKETAKMEARYSRALEQLRRRYPELMKDDFAENSKERTMRRLQKLNYVQGILPKLGVLSGFALRKLTYVVVREMIKKEHLTNELEGWETSEGSKRPITL